MSKPIEYSYMTKEKLMTYTFIALLIITIVSAVLWSPVTVTHVDGTQGWNLGLTVVICALVAVGVAVGIDALFYKVVSDSPLNIMSAAVFGLIVTLSYTLGVPAMNTEGILPVEAPSALGYVALISAAGMVVFKKVMNLAGRKYVNPAAAAKFLVLLPLLNTVFLAKDHLTSGLLGVPSLAGPIGWGIAPQGSNGLASFAGYLQGCYVNPMVQLSSAAPTINDLLQTMILQKFHGWVGGASSLAVIIVGIGLFIVARRYIKWRITLAYLVSVALMSILMSTIYADQDLLLRLLFELFIGSSIFLAFFMATDPATTPITYLGQAVFGVGLAVLTVLIQTYMSFWGGSILALLIMNLTTPRLDRIGILKRETREKEPKRPKGKMFTEIKTTPCVRCGACMRICCNGLSPILIKQAFDKGDTAELMRLDADYCAGCNSCNYVCPARINLRGTMLTYPMAEEDGAVIEQNYLSGTKDENIGVYSELFSAKSNIEGQDGGVATALLVSGIQKGIFDAALVCKRIDGYYSEAVIAENAEEVKAAKGTKYVRVHMMDKLAELIKKGKRKVAIVGTACQMRAARRIQQSIVGEYPDLELTLIGLFCYEEFNYYQLKEQTMKLMNIDLDRAEKTQIKRGKFIATIDGKESSIAVKDLNAAVENGCLCCPDFTAIYSDVSVGSVGSPDGYSTVIVRSDNGKRLLEKLELTKAETDKEEIDKLSTRKKKRAGENAFECPTK
jgi:coenzyme F420-reducing hydrogenase beta subunit/Na+-translocating ferredoxin:NAD+ oxidoreductase RnfD subunit